MQSDKESAFRAVIFVILCVFVAGSVITVALAMDNHSYTIAMIGFCMTFFSLSLLIFVAFYQSGNQSHPKYAPVREEL